MSALQRRTRIPALDAVRGIAIAFVLLRHASPSHFGAAGFVGVELFFVLSGFLITGVLIRDARLPRFYLHRALRLGPALLVLVVLVAIVKWVSDEGGPAHLRTAGVAVALTYTSDIPGMPQLSELGHLWTLAIEEQFYLIWPALLLTSGVRRTPLWLALGVAAWAASTFMQTRGVDAYTSPLTWSVTLLAGCALATRRAPLVPPWMASAALALLAALAVLPDAKSHVWGYAGVIPAVCVVALALIANAVHRPLWVLRLRPLQWLGVVSYSAYLWNYPLSRWLPGPVSIPLTLLAAAASYYAVERPFLRLRSRSGHPRRPATAAEVPEVAARA